MQLNGFLKSEQAKQWVDKENAKKVISEDPVENEVVINSQKEKINSQKWVSTTYQLLKI